MPDEDIGRYLMRQYILKMLSLLKDEPPRNKVNYASIGLLFVEIKLLTILLELF